MNYQFYSVNGRMLGEGPPVSVKAGERVLFHVLNASATAIRSLALPGHAFKVTALDGNPVPHPATVPVLWLGPAERVSAIVEMRNPGKWGCWAIWTTMRAITAPASWWNMPSPAESPVWTKPAESRWDYRLFGTGTAAIPRPTKPSP